MLAGLPYVVWPIGSLFILASRKKEDPFLHYHAVQALIAGAVMTLALLLLMLGLFVAFRVMPGSSTYIPAVLSMGVLFAGGAVGFALLLSAIFLGWRATEGEMLRLPMIGDYAEEKMLDATGMTRRQFEAMLESALVPEKKVEEEEIPFPQVRPTQQAPPPRVETAMDRLEAARRARAAQMAARETRVEVELPGARVPSSSAERPLPPFATPGASPSRQPVVREVDLIGHYKEKKVDTGRTGGQKADVLRNWLSSVDEGN